MSGDIKFCRDCKNFGDMFYSCVRGRRQVGVDPIHGTPEYEYKVNESARHQRESIMPWNCGKKGRYFEPKGKP